MGVSKTVLITGATGFIGRATVDALITGGWQVVQAIRSPNLLLKEGQVYLDLNNPESIIALVKRTRCDAIVHCGALIDFTGATEYEMYIPNVLATGLLTYIAKLWEAQLVFTSTAIVHGIKNESISIDSMVYPDSAYTKGKWLGEQLIVNSYEQHSILRIGGVFGRNGPEHLGLNLAIAGAIRGKVPVQIGSGAALRNYVYVKDVGQAIKFVLQERVFGTHLLAGNEIISFSMMLQQICQVFLPGMHPRNKEGVQAINQIITPSVFLPKSREFKNALLDIQNGGG